mmetsp:Transcript_9890/g.26861  ORF Transcript_9890/g.26861 Transcript_9890/m.26861 type:complete len:293 (-) Transcript_9890:1412-2290(-)
MLCPSQNLTLKRALRSCHWRHKLQHLKTRGHQRRTYPLPSKTPTVRIQIRREVREQAQTLTSKEAAATPLAVLVHSHHHQYPSGFQTLALKNKGSRGGREVQFHLLQLAPQNFQGAEDKGPQTRAMQLQHQTHQEADLRPPSSSTRTTTQLQHQSHQAAASRPPSNGTTDPMQRHQKNLQSKRRAKLRSTHSSSSTHHLLSKKRLRPQGQQVHTHSLQSKAPGSHSQIRKREPLTTRAQQQQQQQQRRRRLAFHGVPSLYWTLNCEAPGGCCSQRLQQYSRMSPTPLRSLDL